MHLVLSFYFFLATALVEVLSFQVAPRATIGDTWGGINITQTVLQVSEAISSQNCNATSYCVQLITETIPKCLRVSGDPSCWCDDVNPVHYCAICMSNSTDNTTTPDQAQAATDGHKNYHIGCSAYESDINGTSTSSMTSSSSTTTTQVATGSSISAGTIGKVVVGGLIGLALISATVFLLYRYIQNKHERIIASTPRAYVLSTPQNDDTKTRYPYGPGTVRTLFPISDTQRENVPYNMRIIYQNC